MKTKTTRKTFEKRNQWRLPKWGTPIVERWYNDCMGETRTLTHAQAQREVIENARDKDKPISPERMFQEIVEDFETQMRWLENKLTIDDIFFRAVFGYSR